MNRKQLPSEVYIALGWCLAYTATMMDKGIDPRSLNVADLLDQVNKDLDGLSRAPQRKAIQLIAEERERQINEEGWTTDHDLRHSPGTLSSAAACYALRENVRWAGEGGTRCCGPWPFDLGWWKPKGFKENLIRAGALIVAELERMDAQAEALKAGF